MISLRVTRGPTMSKPFLAVLAFLVPAAALAAPDCQELVVTGHPYYPPVAWSSGGGLAGAAPRLVTGIAESLGFTKVTTKDFGSWEKAQRAKKCREEAGPKAPSPRGLAMVRKSVFLSLQGEP